MRYSRAWQFKHVRLKRWLNNSSKWLHPFICCNIFMTFWGDQCSECPCSTHRLVVERHHLAAYIPERLGVVVGWVHSCSFGVNPAHLPLVVSEKDGLGSTILYLYFSLYIYTVFLWVRTLLWQHKTAHFGLNLCHFKLNSAHLNSGFLFLFFYFLSITTSASLLKDTRRIRQHSWKSLPPLWSPQKMRWRNSCFSLKEENRRENYMTHTNFDLFTCDFFFFKYMFENQFCLILGSI